MPIKSALRRLPAVVLALGIASPAFAGLFTVTPVRIFMSPRDRATAVTITNESDDELVMQADVYTWAQKPDGEDELTLSEDLILAPPILKLAPRSRQVVRLAAVRTPKTDKQLTYRMIVREIPEAVAQPKNIQLQVALAFSLPVFISPPGIKSDLQCRTDRAARDAVKVTCENQGAAYAQARDFTLSTASGQKLATRENAIYVLPGVKRSVDMKRAEGPIAGGEYKLSVALDDGTVRTYDVTVPE
ncbi:MAG TPA: fimbria/pilus periplasmic chaperone [Usitatibacter sp.]|nr:fimbria/pilus periplasmic chaperone [Usitatibacter sp.]